MTGTGAGQVFPYHEAMTRALPRSRMFAPLVYLAAIVLLVEEWCWDVGMRLARALARWPALAALEGRVRLLPPYGALCAFVLPGLLLLPVKVLALIAIAHGHALSGIATIVVAKVGGAAVVARLYVLTLPTLLAVGWFARCHRWFMAAKTRCLDYLRASHAYHLAGRALRALRVGLRRVLRRLRPRPAGANGRHASRTVRVLRRFVVQWRARRR
jgi:hypothetical protein